MPIDFGTHQRLNNSGLVHASNTMRAGASKVRVIAISRSDLRSTTVGLATGEGLLALFASIDLLLVLQFRDDLVQLDEACVPELAISLEPFRFLVQSVQAQPAGAHAPDLLGDDETRLLEHADVLLHAREGHLELLGQ